MLHDKGMITVMLVSRKGYACAWVLGPGSDVV